MNFDLSEDEEMLKAVAERFVSDRYDGERRRTYLARDAGFCVENWALLGDLGLIAMAFDAENGGLGASQIDIALVAEALGRGLVVEPLIESVLVAGKLFESQADPALKTRWMPGIVSGELRLALAHHETAARYNPAWVESRAVEVSGEWRLNGKKDMVRAGVNANAFIVSARISGDAGQNDGVGLFLVERDAPGLVIHPYRVLDGTVACEVELHDVVVKADCRLSGGLEAIGDAETRAAIAWSAEALGIMETLFAETLDHLKTRQQFGVALGSFQVLQHRMVEHYACIEQARALLHLATMADPSDSDAWGKAIAGARAFIAEASIKLSHDLIQMHGGMGVTDELIIGHGHKRLMMLARHPRDAGHELDRYAGVTG
ncbi:MAG: acyl-CoA dehydrogenase family protein [Sphingorhabdus sp.]